MDINELAMWFSIAEEDAGSAKSCHRDKYYSNSYYFCSQAVEKYLKGFLRYKDVEFKKDHNIPVLVKQCISFDNIFISIQDDCNTIYAKSISLRYPGKRMPPSEKDIKDAFNYIEKIKTLEPIVKIYSLIEETYGKDWRNKLYNSPENIIVYTENKQNRN